MTTILSLKGVSKNYGGLAAAKGVDLDISEGEIVGLIGPNGAGKTTLVNLVTGTERLSSGDILFYNNSIKNLPPYRRARIGIGRTFQVVRVFRELTCLENIISGLLFGKNNESLSSATWNRAEKIVAFIGLNGKENYRAGQLNLSDQKRIQIGRALAMKPKLMILDEAMSGLNPSEISDAIELVRKVSAQKITIIIIEHLLKVIMNLSDKVVVMHQGEKIFEGVPEKVVKDQAVIEAYFGSRYAKKCQEGVLN